MSQFSEKIAYLKGLVNGIDISDEQTKKIVFAIVDALSAASEEISDNTDAIDDLFDEVDDLQQCTDDILDVISDDEFLDEEDEEDDGFYEVVCPSCGETFYFDEEMLDSKDGMICPHCNEQIDIDFCLGEE